MRKLVLVLVVVGVLAGCDLTPTGQDARYGVRLCSVRDKGVDIPVTIMVDGRTGRAWFLTSGMYWQPMPVANSLHKSIEAQMFRDSDMSYAPQ